MMQRYVSQDSAYENCGEMILPFGPKRIFQITVTNKEKSITNVILLTLGETVVNRRIDKPPKNSMGDLTVLLQCSQAPMSRKCHREKEFYE